MIKARREWYVWRYEYDAPSFCGLCDDSIVVSVLSVKSKTAGSKRKTTTLVVLSSLDPSIDSYSFYLHI